MKKTKTTDAPVVTAALPTLPALPKLPKLKRTPKAATTPCGCGCGTLVARTFAPGHDSRLHAWVIRVERGLVAVAPEPHTSAVVEAVEARRVEALKVAKAS